MAGRSKRHGRQAPPVAGRAGLRGSPAPGAAADTVRGRPRREVRFDRVTPTCKGLVMTKSRAVHDQQQVVGPRHTAQAEYPRTRMNVDELRDIVLWLEGTGATVTVKGGPAGRLHVPIADLAAAHPADVDVVTIEATTPNRLPTEPGHVTVHFSASRNGVNLAYSSNDADNTNLWPAYERIRHRLEQGRSGLFQAESLGLSVVVIVALACVALLAKYVVDGGSISAAALILIALVVASGSPKRRATHIAQLLRRHAPAWLDQQSRQELIAERRNSRRDWKVGLLAAVAGAAVTGFVSWLIQP